MKAFFRFVWKEIYDHCHKPTTVAALLAFAVTVVWAAGNLNVQQPPLRVIVQTTGAAPEQIKAAREILSEFSNVKVVEVSHNYIDDLSMRGAGPSIVIVRRADQWVVLHRLPTLQQEQSIDLVSNLIGSSLESGKPWLANSINSAFGEENKGVLATARVARMAALPGESELLLVPRTIALVSVFLPFVLAVRAHSRDLLFGTWPALILAPGGGWLPMIAARLAASTLISMIVFIFLLMMVRPLFGMAPKPGLATQLGAQSLAMFVSSCLGLLAAMVTRNRSQVYVLMACYLLGLMLLSGFFFPLTSATAAIQLGSNLSPLTFAGRLLEDWMFYGSGVGLHQQEVLALLLQAAVAVALLKGASWFTKQSV